MNKPYFKERVLLIFYYGRSGSYFFHSLLDNHPNVISIPSGCLESYDKFWNACDNYDKYYLIYKFIKVYYEMFDPDVKSAGVSITGSAIRDLGERGDLVLNIDINLFITELMRYLNDYATVDKHCFFVGVNYAYYISLYGKQPPENSLIVHQAHFPNPHLIMDFLNFYEDVKVIHVIREPICSLGSHIKHHAKDVKEFFGFNSQKLLNLIVGIVNGGYEYFDAYHKVGRAVRLEDLHSKPEITMRSVSDWLGIPWSDTLLESTFGGLKYSFKSSYFGSVSGFQTNTISVTHDEIFSPDDRDLLYSCMKSKYSAWGYNHTCVNTIANLNNSRIIEFALDGDDKYKAEARHMIFDKFLIPRLQEKEPTPIRLIEYPSTSNRLTEQEQLNANLMYVKNIDEVYFKKSTQYLYIKEHDRALFYADIANKFSSNEPGIKYSKQIILEACNSS